MNGYIYEIRNIQNNKVYIGQTWVPKNRQKRHFSDLRCGRHDNPHLQKAFIKYGEENSFYGKTHSIEAKNKISEKMKERGKLQELQK